eukprot:Nk52_evm6s319 gene=Nk52_evmTU6s319
MSEAAGVNNSGSCLLERHLLHHESPSKEGQQKEEDCITVVQFNTLADELCNTTAFPFVDSKYLQWEYRKELLVDEMLLLPHLGDTGPALLPDIIALEEVDHFEDHFEPRLRDKGYEGRCLLKINPPLDPNHKQAKEETKAGQLGSMRMHNGVCLFHRKDRFSVVCHWELFYNDYLGARVGSEHMSQVALICLWRVLPRPGATSSSPRPQYILGAVTHLKAKAGQEECREKQTRVLVSRICQIYCNELQQIITADQKKMGVPAADNTASKKRRKSSHGGGKGSHQTPQHHFVSVFIAGDFNAKPFEPSYAAITTQAGFTSAYRTNWASFYPPSSLPNQQKDGGDSEPRYTTWKKRKEESFIIIH